MRQMNDDARVLVLYTGGTIGMTAGDRGYEPLPGYLGEQLAGMRRFHDPSWPLHTTPPFRGGRRARYEILEYRPLVDSSNMGRSDWVRIAHDIELRYDDYDGFVVLHGTDTMAYTASALSFMLRDLHKPVILTGSQIPLAENRSDAAENLLGALTLATLYPIPEVGVYFHNRLLRGNRCQKVDAVSLDSFASGNWPALVKVGVDLDVRWGLIRQPTGRTMKVYPITNDHVAAIRLFPGLLPDTLERFLAPPLEGLVLETYGTGNAPDTNPRFLDVLKSATDRGVVIVNCSQCSSGMVNPSYAVASSLEDAGVVSGADMTPEAALTKLAYLLSLGLTLDEVRAAIGRPLRGELTTRARPDRVAFTQRRFVARVAHALADNEADASVVADALYPVLMNASAASGDLPAIEAMVLAGADPTRGDHDRRTPLHLAAAEGHLELVERLLALGAHPSAEDRWGRTPLDEALLAGHTQTTEALRARGGEPGRLTR